jgi:hypothetical protein
MRFRIKLPRWVNITRGTNFRRWRTDNSWLADRSITPLYANPRQYPRRLLAKTAMHRCSLPVSCHPPREPARQRARGLANTPVLANAQRQRKKVEALFVELKNQIGLRCLRLRRLNFVREQFFLAAAARNIRRLVRFLSHSARQPKRRSVDVLFQHPRLSSRAFGPRKLMKVAQCVFPIGCAGMEN